MYNGNTSKTKSGAIKSEADKEKNNLRVKFVGVVAAVVAGCSIKSWKKKHIPSFSAASN